jgi:5-methyltetrahydrofolate--homocysteine methyltransferase
VVGHEAQRVFSDGKRLLQRAIEGRWMQASGVIALLPAATVDDDTIEIYTDESRTEVALRWSPLRLQTERPVVEGVKRSNRSLADFIAPKDSGKLDYIGMFAVTAGLGIERREKQFTDDHDDYSAIMLKALADRLAEAFAERLHQRVRTELWGYAPDEALATEALIAEQYRGIRPAPGYPACPDHSVKRDMFRVLGATDIGMALTDSLAMTPAASVSGFYMAHPQATYFNVGRIGEDQLQDWARRQTLHADDARRLLAPALG